MRASSKAQQVLTGQPKAWRLPQQGSASMSILAFIIEYYTEDTGEMCRCRADLAGLKLGKDCEGGEMDP